MCVQNIRRLCILFLNEGAQTKARNLTDSDKSDRKWYGIYTLCHGVKTLSGFS